MRGEFSGKFKSERCRKLLVPVIKGLDFLFGEALHNILIKVI